MNIEIFSYRYAQEILEHRFYKDAYDEIIKVCEACPLPMYKNKSSTQPKLDIVQQVINTYFRLAFTDIGWEEEPLVSPKDKNDSLRGDFRKKFVKKITSTEDKNIVLQIEVEMGNIASSYRNYFKFQLSYGYNLTNIGILILPCDKLSKRIDSGVASFEKTVREIPSADLSITVPILVIGLNDTAVVEDDIKKITHDLKIVKGDGKKYKEEHNKLVREIMK